MVVQQKPITVAEYEQFADSPENADRRFELIHGEIVEKMPDPIHSWIITELVWYFKSYLKKHPIGKVFVELRFELPTDKINGRIPDLSFVAGTDVKLSHKAMPMMPDLAVEVQSPGQGPKLMRDKADYYLANGTKMVWLIYPDKRLVEVLTLDDRYFLTEEDVLEGGELLPDLRVSVKDILPNPDEVE